MANTEKDTCSCVNDGDDEIFEDSLNFCFVEGTARDKRTNDEKEHLHEEVWYKLKPPKPRCPFDYKPFVTARQLEITRTLLSGKNLPKVDLLDLMDENLAGRVKPSLAAKKSSVRFISDENCKPCADC